MRILEGSNNRSAHLNLIHQLHLIPNVKANNLQTLLQSKSKMKLKREKLSQKNLTKSHQKKVKRKKRSLMDWRISTIKRRLKCLNLSISWCRLMKIMKRNRRNWKQERRHKKNSMPKWQQLSNGHLIRILKVHQINQSMLDVTKLKKNSWWWSHKMNLQKKRFTARKLKD